MSAMGYRQWKPYVEHRSSRESVISNWKNDEHAYVRRQITWFKTNKQIFWFDVNHPSYKQQVVDKVKRWYSDA